MHPTPLAPATAVHPVDLARDEIGNAVCGLLLLAEVVPDHAMAFRKTAQRLQRARAELDTLCRACGGTILTSTRGGVPRGSCHCPANLSRR